MDVRVFDDFVAGVRVVVELSSAVTAASTGYSPGVTPAAGVTANVTVTCSSSRANLTGTDAGAARHPAGSLQRGVEPLTGPSDYS